MRDIQRIDQDIRGLDIAVQNTLFVGVMNGLGNGFDPFGGLLRRNGLGARYLVEVFALDVVHREIVKALVLADLMHAHDSRVSQVRRRFRLGLEPLRGALPANCPARIIFTATMRFRLTCRAL